MSEKLIYTYSGLDSEIHNDIFNGVYPDKLRLELVFGSDTSVWFDEYLTKQPSSDDPNDVAYYSNGASDEEFEYKGRSIFVYKTASSLSPSGYATQLFVSTGDKEFSSDHYEDTIIYNIFAVEDNDPMKNLSKNYNDKDAIKVKNPIADALDRLTAAMDGSSSGGK